MQALVVKLGHPFQRGQFESFTGFPRCSAVDEFSLLSIAIIASRADNAANMMLIATSTKMVKTLSGTCPNRLLT